MFDKKRQETIEGRDSIATGYTYCRLERGRSGCASTVLKVYDLFDIAVILSQREV